MGHDPILSVPANLFQIIEPTDLRHALEESQELFRTELP
jgi:hypothetical protein